MFAAQMKSKIKQVTEHYLASRARLSSAERGAAREDEHVMLKTEHAVLMKRREDELLADLRLELVSRAW